MHLVEFYETDSTLVDCVTSFLAPALSEGEAAIVVATEEHRHVFEEALEAYGVDLENAHRQGRYVALDAQETLTKFMTGGTPDPELFRQGVGALITAVLRCAPKVRIYGEMVALLCDQGKLNGAMALEELWNDLACSRSFDLLCAYPIQVFNLSDISSPFWSVCNQHSSSRLTLVSAHVAAQDESVSDDMRSEIGSVMSVIQRALMQRMLADGLFGAAPAASEDLVCELRSPDRQEHRTG